MKDRALGFIETYGYIASIEAADASLKAANVKLIGWEKVQGGLVTIKLQGDVSAVKTAVDVGASAASLVGSVISTTVIARPGEGLERIVVPGEREEEEKPVEKKPIEKELKEVEIVEGKVEDMEERPASLEPVGEGPMKIEFEERIVNIKDRKELEDLKVVELRKLARLLENTNMDNKDIRFGKKDELITAILSFAERGD